MSDIPQYNRGEAVLIVSGVYKRKRQATFLRYAGAKSADVQIWDGKANVTKTIRLRSIRRHPSPPQGSVPTESKGDAQSDAVSELSTQVTALVEMHDAIGKQIRSISEKLSELTVNNTK